MNAGYNPARLSVELVPLTAWWSNVRSNVTKAQWEKCKKYSKTKTNGVCIICGGTGRNQGRRYDTEAHEIWDYDDEKQIQTLIDIVPLCPRCHQCKHMGRSRSTMNLRSWTELIEHFQRVNGWPDWKVEKYLSLIFQIWEIRSKMRWTLDLSMLERIGVDVPGGYIIPVDKQPQ